MGEPWTTLMAAGAPSILVAYLTYRGLMRKESFGARATEVSRLDAVMRDILDRTAADNARLRKENSDSVAAIASLMSLARRWCDCCHDMRHGRINDRAIADAELQLKGLPPVKWNPLPPLPGFEEIG